MKLFIGFLLYQLSNIKLASKISLFLGTFFWSLSNYVFLFIDDSEERRTIFGRIYDWYLYNEDYTLLIMGTIIVDYIIGTWRYAGTPLFDIRKNIGGFFTKLGLVLLGGYLFEAMGGIVHKSSMIKDWAVIVGRLIVFVWPAYTAWKNLSIITKGQFPPKSWIIRIEKFKGNLNPEELFKNDKT